jgi:tRNA(Ile)-lysidine synthase TilS/MesJ
MMQREREKRSWGERDRGRTLSYRGDQLVKPEVAAHQASAAKQYRAALEALFEKKSEVVDEKEKEVPATTLPRVVEASNPDAAVSNKRQDLLRKIGSAQGSKAISDAIEAFLTAGHTLPDDQEVFLQMLEHRNETRVREAIVQLERLIAGQLPKRKPVLVQRLKRIEEMADDLETRDAAATLRRRVA